MHTERQRDTHKGRQTGTNRDRERQITHRETEIDREMDTHREAERQTDTEGETER